MPEPFVARKSVLDTPPAMIEKGMQSFSIPPLIEGNTGGV